MRKPLFKCSLLAVATALALFSSCTKPDQKKENPVNDISAFGYSKTIQEIDMKLEFSFQRNSPDSFKIKLSDNFTLEQVNSLFNTEQNREYFTLRCKKNRGDAVYFITGTVDATNVVTVSHSKAN